MIGTKGLSSLSFSSYNSQFSNCCINRDLIMKYVKVRFKNSCWFLASLLLCMNLLGPLFTPLVSVLESRCNSSGSRGKVTQEARS